MATVNDPNVEGFIDGVRFAWAVHLMIEQERSTSREVSGALSRDLASTYLCLEHVCSHNVFKFFLSGVLQTAAYQVRIITNELNTACGKIWNTPWSTFLFFNAPGS